MAAFGEEQLETLRLDYSDLQFRLYTRWGRQVIEAWREGAPGSGFYAMVCDDPGEMRAGLDAAGCRPVTVRQR